MPSAGSPTVAIGLLKQATSKVRLNLSGHRCREIAHHHGALSIRRLSDQIGISQNHLDTQFKRMIGISPKEFARLSRFFSVLRSIDPMQPVDWMRIAHQAGFYDQSHFN